MKLLTSRLAATCHKLELLCPIMESPTQCHKRNKCHHNSSDTFIIIVHPSNDAPGFAFCAGNAMVRIIRQNANVALSSTENRWAVTDSSLQVCMPTVQNGHGSCKSLRTLFFEELRSFFHDLFIFLWLNTSRQKTSTHINTIKQMLQISSISQLKN